MPDINVDLNLIGLGKIVSEFSNRGFKLADKFLCKDSNNINNIELILGTKSGYCIPETEVTFGYNNSSLYSVTKYGIMLKGDINEMLDNCPYLKYEFDNFKLFKNTSLASYYETCDSLSSKIEVIDKSGNINESELLKATKEILNNECSHFTNLDCNSYSDDHELNDKIVKFALENLTRDDEGRLVIPLLWNSNSSHLLAKNQNLAQSILNSMFKKLDSDKLNSINEVFKEQVSLGIIEKVDNVKDFLDSNNNFSFLPHMAVFKNDRQTTKCRVVFLSNLSECDSSQVKSVSHNQAMHPGPNLNQKILTSILHLRFDEKLCCFDIKKAFNNISLKENDQNKLLFYWYNDVQNKDFSLVVYRNKRLSFGLRCSPTILLLGLYYILILNTNDDSYELKNLKSMIYSLCYMDNCSFSCTNSSDLIWSFNQLESIFSPFHFGLQQFVTNDEQLQEIIDRKFDETTPEITKLLGIQWNRKSDRIFTKQINLDENANTKRLILASVASQYDPFNFNGPLLNRARLYLHELQCNQNIDWDEKLSSDDLRNWHNIVKQANNAQVIEIPRCLGNRTDEYKIIGFCDSSKTFYGSVIYIQNLNTNKVSFLMSKNKIVSKQLESKSIPSLEMQGISLASEVVIDLYKELSGSSCVNPIKIKELEIYTDSQVALSWLNAAVNDFAKLQKKSVFVQNRINHIEEICKTFPIKFSFVSGFDNPADCVTRCLSYKKLLGTTYLTGPKFLSDNHYPDQMSAEVLPVIIPNPLSAECSLSLVATSGVLFNKTEHLIPLDRFSSFRKLVVVIAKVFEFIKILKSRLILRDAAKYSHLKPVDKMNPYSQARHLIIKTEQQICLPEVFEYFLDNNNILKNLPNVVSQLGIYLDRTGLLRVKCKLEKLVENTDKMSEYPIFMPRKSVLVNLIITYYHEKCFHAGTYTIIAEIRRLFYIPKIFSAVKMILRKCIVCKRFNARPICLNQNSYRLNRIDPLNIPFANIYFDFFGPYEVKDNSCNKKVYVLCITCVWSRAINLKICINLSTKEFVRAFQLHCLEFGVPQHCISDMGTQLISGAKIMSEFMNDVESQDFFRELGVSPISFEQYFKGHSQLGSMVEICVKLTKRLIYGGIRNNILPFRDFEFIIFTTIHLVNRRPIAFRDCLRDSEVDIPKPITPENLIRGYDLVSINLIPELHGDGNDWVPSGDPVDLIKMNFTKLQKCNNLIHLYNEEFFGTLVKQATNKKDRFKPKNHEPIQKNDIVLLKEAFTKPSNYPMGLVKDVEVNSLGEVTGASILKGSTGELVKRHSSVLIPLLTRNEMSDETMKIIDKVDKQDNESKRPQRQSSKDCLKNIKLLVNKNLV